MSPAPESPRPGVPPGRTEELPGRGRIWVRELPGPASSPTVVLLHGWIATGALNWFPVFEPLAHHYRVLAVDHRGHGRGIRTARFRLADCADDVAHLLDRLGIGEAIAVGYSMGGPIAQLLWHRHPRRVGGLVLCATARDFRGTREAGLVDAILPNIVPVLGLGGQLVPGEIRRRLLRRFLESRIANPEAREWVVSEMGEHDPRGILGAGRAISRFSSREWAGRIDVPVAVVVTERDRLVSPASQRKLAETIPGATLHPIDGDHLACSNRQEEFTRVLLEACASVVSRGTGESLRRIS